MHSYNFYHLRYVSPEEEDESAEAIIICAIFVFLVFSLKYSSSATFP